MIAMILIHDKYILLTILKQPDTKDYHLLHDMVIPKILM